MDFNESWSRMKMVIHLVHWLYTENKQIIVYDASPRTLQVFLGVPVMLNKTSTRRRAQTTKNKRTGGPILRTPLNMNLRENETRFCFYKIVTRTEVQSSRNFEKLPTKFLNLVQLQHKFVALSANVTLLRKRLYSCNRSGKQWKKRRWKLADKSCCLEL